jgi:hypothetical protein
MGDIMSNQLNPLAALSQIPSQNSPNLLNLDADTSERVKTMYSVAMPRPDVFPTLSPSQDQMISDIEFCKTYPTTLPPTGNPFTDGPSTDRFNQICGMCMTEGRFLTGGKFPVKGSPGPAGTGVVVYPEDKQVATGNHAIPSFNCAHCATMFMDEPVENVTHVAINSDQYIATLQYIEDNDLLYSSGCSSSASNDNVQCNNSEKRIIESNLFYGSWNEGTCGQVTADDTDFVPERTQLPNDLGCYGKSSCDITFPTSVKNAKEWEIEGRCDFLAPPLNPTSYTINTDCLPVILASLLPSFDGTTMAASQATPIWGFDTNGNIGPFKFVKDYPNPDKKRSFKATLSIIMSQCTGKVLINGKVVKFQVNGAEVESINGFHSTRVIIPVGTSRISVHTDRRYDGNPNPCIFLTIIPVKKPGSIILSTDVSWVYTLKGYKRSFKVSDTPKCQFIPQKYAAQYASDPEIARMNGNQEALAYHWITKGLNSGRSPCGDINPGASFNDAVYKCMNVDVFATKGDSLNNYLTSGFKEGKNIAEVQGVVCKVVPSPETAILWQHCENGSGWYEVLPGQGDYYVNTDFPWDSSYIVVGSGIVATLTSGSNQTHQVQGPGEFNFCSIGGFNDNVQRIQLLKPDDGKTKDLGCWNDTWDRMLKGPYPGRGYNKETCGASARANNKKYFSIQDGNECYTGNNSNYTRYGPAKGQCPDTGGAWKAHVWENKAYVVPTPSIRYHYGCEHNTVDIRCPSGTIIHDGRIYYGKWGNSKCDGTTRPTQGAIGRLPGGCVGNESCRFVVNNNVGMGDPYPGVLKQYEVTSVCSDPDIPYGAPGPHSAPGDLDQYAARRAEQERRQAEEQRRREEQQRREAEEQGRRVQEQMRRAMEETAAAARRASEAANKCTIM